MKIRTELLAPCGLYCGVCRIFSATQENDLLLLRRLAKIYRILPGLEHLTAEDMPCDGCLSERRFEFCRECLIRDCTEQQGYLGCHECTRFPCNLIDAFPSQVGKQVMLRAIPYRQTHGTEQWILAEEARYLCPECGERLFRGVTQCHQCSSEVALD